MIPLALVAASTIVASGCNCSGGNDGPVASKEFGRFEPPVADVQLLADGRNATLLKSFRYIEGGDAKKVWEAPAGTQIDGASIPQVFWSVIGGPYEGKYRFASIVHDRYCTPDHHGGRTWQQVHRMFYNACLAGGTDEQQAKLMYAAVYHFGPRWSDEKKGVEELAELIPPERARIAEVLEEQAPPSTRPTTAARTAMRPIGPEALRRLREAAAPTERQYRDAVLAPRRRGPADLAPAPDDPLAPAAVAPTLAKWDRIRERVRENANVSLEELEQTQ